MKPLASACFLGQKRRREDGGRGGDGLGAQGGWPIFVSDGNRQIASNQARGCIWGLLVVRSVSRGRG